MFRYFRYYGLWMWFPELFNRLNIYYKDHPNATVGVCDITNYQSDTQLESSCNVDSQVFLDQFLISLAAAPGNIWTMVHMDRLGRKFFLGK